MAEIIPKTPDGNFILANITDEAGNETTSDTEKIILEVCQTNIQDIDVLFDLNQTDDLSAHQSITNSIPEIYSRIKMPSSFGNIAKSLRPVLTRIGMIAYYSINNPLDKPPYTNGWDLSEDETSEINNSLNDAIIEEAKKIIANPNEISGISKNIQIKQIVTAIAYLKVNAIFEKLTPTIIDGTATDIDTV